MRISPETAFLTNLTRSTDTARTERRTAEQDAFQSSVSGRDAGTQQTVRQVNAASKLIRAGEKPQDDPESSSQQFEPMFAREAPTGMRPKYIPKGQVVDMMV